MARAKRLEATRVETRKRGRVESSRRAFGHHVVFFFFFFFFFFFLKLQLLSLPVSSSLRLSAGLWPDCDPQICRLLPCLFVSLPPEYPALGMFRSRIMSLASTYELIWHQ